MSLQCENYLPTPRAKPLRSDVLSSRLLTGYIYLCISQGAREEKFVCSRKPSGLDRLYHTSHTPKAQTTIYIHHMGLLPRVSLDSTTIYVSIYEIAAILIDCDYDPHSCGGMTNYHSQYRAPHPTCHRSLSIKSTVDRAI